MAGRADDVVHGKPGALWPGYRCRIAGQQAGEPQNRQAGVECGRLLLGTGRVWVDGGREGDVVGSGPDDQSTDHLNEVGPAMRDEGPDQGRKNGERPEEEEQRRSGSSAAVQAGR